LGLKINVRFFVLVSPKRCNTNIDIYSVVKLGHFLLGTWASQFILEGLKMEIEPVVDRFEKKWLAG
jgi:hypothetical protein